MDEVPISQLKASFDKILKRAQKTKQPIRIAYRGKQVADITIAQTHARPPAYKVNETP